MAAIAAAGAGRMGRGIAIVFAYAGHDVALVDLKERPAHDLARLRREALSEVRATLDMLSGLGLMPPSAVEPILARVCFAGRDEAPVALAAADVIFEGVPETLPAKREALELVSRLARPDAILASTTSTIVADELQAFVAPPGRFLNAHWLNPAYLVPLVEVSPGKDTDADTTARLVALLEAIGKVPVVCKASPGFIVPRLQALVMNEAARLVEEGVASAEDIDKATLLRLRLPLRRPRRAGVHRLGWRRHPLSRQPLSDAGHRQRPLRRAEDRGGQHGRRPHRPEGAGRLPGLFLHGHRGLPPPAFGRLRGTPEAHGRGAAARRIAARCPFAVSARRPGCATTQPAV